MLFQVLQRFFMKTQHFEVLYNCFMKKISNALIASLIILSSGNSQALDTSDFFSVDRGSGGFEVLKNFTLKDDNGRLIDFRPSANKLFQISFSRSGLLNQKVKMNFMSDARDSGVLIFGVGNTNLDRENLFNRSITIAADVTGQNIAMKISEYIPEEDDDFSGSEGVSEESCTVESREEICTDGRCSTVITRKYGTRTVTTTVDEGESGSGMKIEFQDRGGETVARGFFANSKGRPRRAHRSAGPCIVN